MARGLRMFLAGALLFASIALAPVGALAADRPYDHRWAAEGMFVGDVGATAATTLGDSVTLKLSKGEWLGTVVYSDVLGMSNGSGEPVSQVSHIRLELTGATLEGGTSVGGRFTGTATLVTSTARSLSEAASPARVDVKGDTAVYDVSGYWAAKLAGTTASGELYYQSARVREGHTGEIHEADWFNRATGFEPGDMGSPQSFAVVVSQATASAAGASGSKKPLDGPGSAPSGDAVAKRPSVLSYILKGIRGAAVSTPLPVSAAQSAAARALVDAKPNGATALPAGALAVDLGVAGAVLDAKNRAAGLLGRSGPKGAAADEARAAFAGQVRSAPVRPALADDEDAGTALAKRLTTALNAQAGAPGAAALGADIAAIPAGADADTVMRLRAWVAIVEALALPEPTGSSLAAVTGVAASVAEKPVPRSGATADAVLAAADSVSAPDSALDIARFERRGSLDTSSTTDGSTPVARLFALQRAQGQVTPAVQWTQAGATQSASPASWLAYRRADGTLFWRAGADGVVAVTSADLLGWAWSSQRVAVVDAARVGRVYSLVELVAP